MTTDQRSALARLIEDKGEDYAGLSRLIGRNPAYIQQFIKRGIPKKLDEKDRKVLAEYFDVSEEALGGPPSPSTGGKGLVRVARLDIGASAGPGALAGEERAISHMGFDEKWLRRLSRGPASQLSMISVRGDSMAPTLADGDDILVDRSDAARSLRDGIYVIRREDTLLVKRVALSPSVRRVTIKSDNNAYPSWPDVDLAEIDIIGRVIWTGRKLT
jgi:phage repressor protein C with HTH and peptisase S24 domain